MINFFSIKIRSLALSFYRWAYANEINTLHNLMLKKYKPSDIKTRDMNRTIFTTLDYLNLSHTTIRRVDK